VRIGSLLAHLQKLETELAGELRSAAERRREDHDVYHQCHTFAVTADERAQKVGPLTQRYEGKADWNTAVGEGSDDLLEDLRALYLRVQEAAVTWVMAAQAAKALRDEELLTVAADCHSETETQAKWFLTRIKTGAPQPLVVG
jgi:hypothetical protein